jgi:hypothetical protein
VYISVVVEDWQWYVTGMLITGQAIPMNIICDCLAPAAMMVSKLIQTPSPVQIDNHS